MATESSFFDLLITGGVYLIFVVVLALALYLVRLRRRGTVAPSVARRGHVTLTQLVGGVRARIHLPRGRS
ncbi:MAG TPA: hypothetical protein VIL85_04075 [Thermomicrobiales bacterium]